MRYNEYGKTGIKLSVIGCGGAKYDNGQSIEENSERLLYAHSKGINHFDCGPGYRKSEDVVGHALRQLPKNSFYTTTKDQVIFFKSKSDFKDKISKSLEKMNLDYFDFFYIWNLKKMEEYAQCLAPGGQYETLLELKQEGLIRHILLSSHLTGEESAQIIEDGKIEGILLNMNIMNFPYAWKAAVKAKEKGIGVGAMSPLAGGLIPMYEDKFSFLSSENSPTYEALKFITSLPVVDFCYLSTKSKSEVDVACEIADINQPLDDEAIIEKQKLIGEGLTAACTGCQYCDNVCPKNIPIPAYMQFYNMKHIFSMTDDDLKNRLASARKWFMLARRKADAMDCIQCGKCEKQCTQKIDIANRMKYLGEIEKALI